MVHCPSCKTSGEGCLSRLVFASNLEQAGLQVPGLIRADVQVGPRCCHVVNLQPGGITDIIAPNAKDFHLNYLPFLELPLGPGSLAPGLPTIKELPQQISQQPDLGCSLTRPPPQV